MAKPSLHEIAISALLACSLLLTWCVSHPALSGAFLFDDFPNFENLREISGCFSGDHIANYLASFAGTPGRPLAALSFLIDDYAWPSTPYSWKRHNLLLHLLCGVLIFGLSRTLARVRYAPTAANWVALATAAAWLLHPMQLSTSMLTVQRMTQLMTLISLSACWWIAHRLASNTISLLAYAKLLVIGVVLTVLACLCKENGALLPMYLAITSAWMLQKKQPLSTYAGKAYFTALSIPIILVIAALAYAAITQESNGIRNFSPLERQLTETRILWDYLRQILMPRLDGSGIFHDDIEVSRGLLTPTTTILSVISTIALIAFATAKRKSLPILAFAVAWYFGGHIIESTTWPLELYFEHRNYLPMIGVLFAACVSIAAIPTFKIRITAIIAAIMWLMTCAGMTYSSARVWGSTHLQAAIWASEHPNSLRAAEFQAKIMVDEHDLVSARKLITDNIARDRRFNGLAIHVLLLDCYTGRLQSSSFDWATNLLKESEFNRSTLDSLSILRDKLQGEQCGKPELIGKWLKLASTLLAHSAYQTDEIQSYIYIQLMRDALFRRDFDAVVRSLDAAYRRSPNPTLAFTLSRMLRDAGYNNEAAMWNRRANQLPAPWPVSWWQWMKRTNDQHSSQCALPSRSNPASAATQAY